MADDKQEVMEAVTSLRELVETKTEKLDALDMDKIKNLEEFLDKQETKNQELTKAVEEQKSAEEELKEEIKGLETRLSRPGQAGDDEKTEIKAALDAQNKFVQFGEDQLSADEAKYLRTDSDVDGGYLTTPDYLNEIIKDITEISPIRSIARVRSTGKGRLHIPVRTGSVTAAWEGEGETGTDSNSTYGQEKMPLNKITVTVPITLEELDDADFDMTREINSDIAEEFARLEGAAFVNGDAVKKPEGFMVNTDIAASNSGIADNIDMDAVRLLAGQLKTGYNPTYVMNRLTIAAIRNLKDGMGQYLWNPGNTSAGIPNQINGYNYVEVPDMDDIAANAHPIAIGDFRRGYLIGDRMALNMIRDPYTLKKSAKVEFTFLRRVGGQVIKPEAIKKLKCSL